MVTTFTYRPSLVIDARNFRVIVVTDPQTEPQTYTHRQDRLQYTAPQLAQCNKKIKYGQVRLCHTATQTYNSG